VSAGGCATKKDTRYLKSTLGAPLTIPAGLDTPQYTQTMEIPPVAPGAGKAGETGDIEKPPAIRHQTGGK
jgi:uncharacterized lipoprotein